MERITFPDGYHGQQHKQCRGATQQAGRSQLRHHLRDFTRLDIVALDPVETENGVENQINRPSMKGPESSTAIFHSRTSKPTIAATNMNTVSCKMAFAFTISKARTIVVAATVGQSPKCH